MGPLFNIFINDISQLGMTNMFFADAAVETFQGFVSILCDLPNTNKLVVHESKIKLMLFISKIHPVPPDIRFNLIPFEWVSHTKYLEIILDNIFPYIAS